MQNNFGCQVCLTNSSRIHELTKHVRSKAHRQKMEEVFQKEKFSNPVNPLAAHIPFISVIPLLRKQDSQPIIGLSVLTFCFSSEKNCFYLCHACEEKCHSDRTANHLFSADHCSNYFGYTYPNVLKFSWMPSMDMRSILKPHVKREVNISGAGQLQLLQLPENLMKQFETSSYSEVMHTLSENGKLLKLIEAVKPNRTMIQAYQKDSNRKHPLLGMQHIVECICVGLTERRHYLCTLCKLTVATHMIIKHVLSFDHIFFYFRAWHPSTLMSKECYKDPKSLAPIILDFAKQSEEILGTANADMKQVSLEPDKFASVNFTCYAEALKQLESIRKENGESSLIISIKPGNKLERQKVTVSARSAALSCKLRCQDCNVIFETVRQYLNHVPKPKHKQMLMEKFFIKGETADQKGYIPHQDIHTHLIKSLEQNQPAIGLSLVVMCITTEVQVKPIYVCFACEECFPEYLHKQHFSSRKHLIYTLRHQNPWRLPFAWENHLDVKVLKSLAWEEEKERGPDQMMLKILDMPHRMFGRLILDYTQVMKSLVRHHTVLKREVPQCETYRKLQQNERFPLLGEKFMVMFDVCVKGHPQSTEVAFMCFLCKRRLSNEECHAHVFSREHVATFLERSHPGSLNSSTDAVTLLDLAKQAACIHPASTVKVIKLKRPIWEPCTYETANWLLASAVRRDGKDELEPQIIPKNKLVPREILKEEDKGHVRDKSQENSQMIEESQKQTSQKSTENSETTLKKISVEVGAEINNAHSVESGKHAEKEADKETPTSSEKESERGGEVFSEASSDKIKTCQVIKEEKIEEPTVKMPSGETPESCQNTDEAGGEGKTVTGHKWQRLTPKQEPSCEDAQILPSIEQKEVTTAEEGGKLSHDTAKDDASSDTGQQDKLWHYVKRKSREPLVGLDTLLECHCDQHDPIYLCECCSVKIPEKDVISHVIGAEHQKMYLVGSKKLSSPMGKHLENSLRHVAALYEQENGYGDAQIAELDEETYSNVSKQNFTSAIQMVKALQEPQDSYHDLPSTSALSAVRPLDASVTLHTQHEVCSVGDDFQVVDMEIDDNAEDSLTAAVSVMTENTSKTTGVPPESNECVKMQQIKVSESAESATTCLTVSRSSEDASSLHVSTSGTKTPCLHPVSTGNDLKTDIISNTTGGPLKITTTSKIVGTPQYSDSAVTTSTKSMTAISKSASSTSDTTKSTTPNSSLKATTSSCPTTSKERETAHKCVATTSSATATITKCTAADHNPSTTSKIENASKYIETASQTTTQAKVTSVKCKNTEGSAKTVLMKNSVGPNADVAPNVPKSSAPAAPHRTGLMSVRSENKNPHTEPSCTSTSKAKPSKSCPKSGLNQLIRVRCKQKQQVYCQLCSVKVVASGSEHLDDYSHKFNYVNKFFGGDAKPSQFESKEKLNMLVAGLAEVEIQIGSCNIQGDVIEVTIDVYEELAHLPQEIALERLKAMLRQRDSQDSSSSTANTAEEVVFASPYGASSPDEGKYMSQKEAAGPSTDSRSEQQSNPELRTLLVQTPVHSEIESVSKGGGNLAAGHSDRAQSSKSSEPEANDRISDQLHSCPTVIKKQPEPIADTPSIQDTEIAVNIKREPLEPDVESQAMVEVISATESPAVKMERPEVWPLTAAACRFACKETAETRQQQERLDPKLQDTQNFLEGMSLVKFFNPDLFPPAASANTEQQNQSRPSQDAEHVPKHSGCSPAPGNHIPSQALPNISRAVTGERPQDFSMSTLSTFLSVKGLSNKPIIGLGSVWECQGITLRTIFLCENCREKIDISDICQHMISTKHQCNCIMRKRPDCLWFLKLKDENLIQRILSGVVWLFSKQESANKMDAQVKVVRLREDLHKRVETASFSEALELVQNIKKEGNQNDFCPPISTPQQNDQQPEDQQSRAESLPTEKQSAHALETDQRSGNEERQKTEQLDSQETSGKRSVTSPLDVTRAVVSPLPGANTCHMQPELRPPISQQQRPVPELLVEQAEVCSESPSSSVSPKTSQTLSVSPREECHPTRKRPAVTPPETLVRPDTNNPQIEDPLPPKRKCSSLQPISQPSTESTFESTPVNAAANSTPLCTKDKLAGPTSDEQGPPTVDWEQYTRLAELLREKKSKIKLSACRPGPDNAEATTSGDDNSSATGVKRGCDSKCVQTTSTMAKKPRRWDSKMQFIKATVTKDPPSPDSSEEMFSTAALVFSRENHLVTPNATVTEAKEVSTMLPCASSTDPSDPQHQRSVDPQSNVSQFKPSPFHCAAIDCNPAQIPQPQGHTTTDSTENCKLPINAIITARPEPANKQFMGSYNGQDLTQVNRGHQVIHGFSTVPSYTLAPSGGYGLYSQMSYVTNGQASNHLSSEAVAGYTTPDNLSLPTGGFYQPEGYTSGVFYPSQIYPQQEANLFGVTQIAPGSMRLQMQQQLLPQQHYSSWPSAPAAAGAGQATNEAAYPGAVPFTAPAYANAIPPPQNSNITTQNCPQVYLNPPVTILPQPTVKSHPRQM